MDSDIFILCRHYCQGERRIRSYVAYISHFMAETFPFFGNKIKLMECFNCSKIFKVEFAFSTKKKASLKLTIRAREISSEQDSSQTFKFSFDFPSKAQPCKIQLAKNDLNHSFVNATYDSIADRFTS